MDTKSIVDFLDRLQSFQDGNICSACFLQQSHYLFKESVRLIKIQHDASFGHQQYFFQCWHLMLSYVAIMIFQKEFLNISECRLCYQPFTIGGTIQPFVMHEDELTVFSALYIDFNYIATHLNNAVDGIQRILRELFPISTVRHDMYIMLVSIHQLFADISGGVDTLPLVTKIIDKLFRAIGLDKRSSHFNNLSPNGILLVLFHGSVIIQTGAKRGPKSVDPHFASRFLNAVENILKCLVYLGKTHFKCFGLHVFDVFFHHGHSIRIGHINDRHKE